MIILNEILNLYRNSFNNLEVGMSTTTSNLFRILQYDLIVYISNIIFYLLLLIHNQGIGIKNICCSTHTYVYYVLTGYILKPMYVLCLYVYTYTHIGSVGSYVIGHLFIN